MKELLIQYGNTLAKWAETNAAAMMCLLHVVVLASASMQTNNASATTGDSLSLSNRPV